MLKEERQIILFEYYMIGQNLYIFAITPSLEQPDLFGETIDLAELRRFVLTNFGQHSAVQDLVALELEELWHGYDFLVAPIASLTRPNDIICIVPYGLLHYLPFHALKIEGQYLIERNPLLYCPSASMLKYCQLKRKQGVTLTAAVFGDALGDLTDARAEAGIGQRSVQNRAI